jgi:hypothetical protein
MLHVVPENFYKREILTQVNPTFRRLAISISAS